MPRTKKKVSSISKKVAVSKTVRPEKKLSQERVALQEASLNAWGRFLLIVRNFSRKHWIGTVLILTATIIFWWPVIIHITNYSVGGDAMFNAWTLDRDQHCILGQGCPNFANANIFFPHKDTMLYSEVQLSTGLVTLPLHLLNANPIFTYNVWTIVSFFLGGWFMYLLAKYLSKGNEVYSVFAGLIFEFAPFKMAAIWHLQNLSIFCLPLAALLIFRYFDTKNKSYLWGLFLALLYQNYASWYQMVFVALTLATILGCLLLFRRVQWRRIAIVAIVIAVAAAATLPLALQYVHWSKTNGAKFSILDQTLYSSSVEDYFIPENGTIIGKAYYKLRPGTQVNAFNLDSFSYHGLVLYAIAAFLLVVAFRSRKYGNKEKRRYQDILMYTIIAVVGFVLSLGPLLMIKGRYVYGTVSGTNIQLAVIAPWMFIDKFLPQLDFIRGVGRISVLCEFALCCLLAYLAVHLTETSWSKKTKQLITLGVCLLAVIELAPIHFVPIQHTKYAYNLDIPKVYQFIAHHKQVNDLIILQSENYYGVDFQFNVPETVMWAGYTNKNIFNGYSGYVPPEYQAQYDGFNNFVPRDASIMRRLGLRYVVVDKLLTTNKPHLLHDISEAFPQVVYHDNRYVIFKIQ